MANPKFWSVAKFAEFQHYRQRNPPWIKLHTALLDEERYIALPDAQKAALMGLFLQAARSNNKIMNDARWLQGKLGMKVKPDLEMLAARKWLVPYHDASDPVEVNRQRGSSKTLASGASKALARDARDAQDTQETNKKTNKTPTRNTQNSDKTPTKPQYNASKTLARDASKTLASGRLPQSETETETETYIQDPPPTPPPGKSGDGYPSRGAGGRGVGDFDNGQKILQAWNAMAEGSGLAGVSLMTPGRLSMLKRLLTLGGWDWTVLVDVAKKAYTLKNGTFSPDFDWVFGRRENCLRVLERAKAAGNGGGTTPALDKLEKALEGNHAETV